LLVEGEGLLDVLGVRGVKGQLTRSTHIAEVEKTLGIEAARQVRQRGWAGGSSVLGRGRGEGQGILGIEAARHG
jgi:hypothetical protein